MWSLFGKLAPVLLAATSSTTRQQELRSPQDLSNSFRQIYTDLQHPGAIYQHSTPTLRFSYVTPRLPNGTSTWRRRNYNVNNPDYDHDAAADHVTLEHDKPTAVYLPGLDGYGISAQRHQFDDLADAFHFWRLTVLPDDRSSFATLVKHVAEFCENLAASSEQQEQQQPVTLIGESCGGLLAAAVAIKLQAANKTNVLKGLVLVNPATSFDQTAWDTLVPLLTGLQYLDTRENNEEDGRLTPYAVLGSLILASIIPDDDQFQRITNTILNLPDLQQQSAAPLLLLPPSLQSLRDIVNATADAFAVSEERLPPALLEHRVSHWLTVGTQVVNPRIHEIADDVLPTLIVAGQDDKLMPSQREAERLCQILPHAEKLIVKGRGHFVLDETVNLTEAIVYSKIDPLSSTTTKTKKSYDPILDWKLPKNSIDEYIAKAVQPFRDIFSPVYFSTDDNGKRWMGMGKIPRRRRRRAAVDDDDDDKPILFVANHQFAALDLRFILADLYEERGIFPRGLAHPVAFLSDRDRNLNFADLGGREPGVNTEPNNNDLGGGFERFGAVLVSPRNYYRLMQTGQDALLFPGGGEEALSGNKSYPLFWPEKVDFVRTAARFNATIVPLSAVGMVDSVNVVAEPRDLLNVPIFGDRLKQLAMNTTSARYDRKPEDEVIGIPLAVPQIPARNYLIFGKAIDTTHIDPSNKEACEKIYIEAKSEVRRGIDDLLRAREHDPFKNTPARLAYERVFRKKAPTFPVSELN